MKISNENKLNETELTLAIPEELLARAKETAEAVSGNEVFRFTLRYDANRAGDLRTVLQAACVVPEEETEDTVTVNLTMEQLQLLKELDFVEQVLTEEDSARPEIPEHFVSREASAADVVPMAMVPEPEATATGSSSGKAGMHDAEAAADGSAAVAVQSSCCECPTNKDMESAKTIAVGSFVSGCICCPGAEQWFKFTVPESKTYTIYTSGSLDTIGTLLDCCGNALATNDDYAGKLNFRMIQNLTAGMTYYVRVRTFGNTTGSYTFRVTDRMLASRVSIHPTSITLEKGVLYELPVTPNYTYKGYLGAKRIPGLSVSLTPANATEQKIWWWEQYGGVLKCSYGWDDDGDRYIHIIANGIGTSKLYAQDWNENGMRGECTVTVDNMLIYRTRNRERLGFSDPSDNNDTNPITAEDLTYGGKSTQTMITNGTRISMSDLNNYKSISQRVTIIKNFFNSQINYDETFMEILSEMVDHFIDGTGADYSNIKLTSAVQSHSRTKKYVNAVITLVNDYISKNKHTIGNLAYDEALWTQPIKRASHLLVNAMNVAISNGIKELYLPSYGYNNGVPGLTLALDGFYGNKIRLKDFQDLGNTYCGSLEFTFYDHFGLDTPDLADEKYGNLTAGTLPGFRQWYILQHWSELEGMIQPKPFVTNVSFSVPISGRYE